MNKKKLKYAFDRVIKAAEETKCESLHHAKKHRHEAGEMCPAEYELHKQANIIREYMKTIV